MILLANDNRYEVDSNNILYPQNVGEEGNVTRSCIFLARHRVLRHEPSIHPRRGRRSEKSTIGRPGVQGAGKCGAAAERRPVSRLE